MSQLVEINVGGKIFMTEATTLGPSKLVSSTLSRLQKDNKCCQNNPQNSQDLRDSSGRIFIDRDPDMFSFVLQFLRDLKTKNFPDKTKTWLKGLAKKEKILLLNESEYYGLKELTDAVSGLLLPDNFATDVANLTVLDSIARCHSDNEIAHNVDAIRFLFLKQSSIV